MSERLRIPVIVVVAVIAFTGAFAVLTQPEDPMYVFPDDGQTWIALHSVSLAHGTPILNYPGGALTLTAADGSIETVELALFNRGPFVVESSGSVEFCIDGGLCRDVAIEHGTLYEFWTDTDEVFTTKTPTFRRIRDGGRIL